MPIYTITDATFGSFFISNYNSPGWRQPISGLSANTLRNMNLSPNSESGDRVVFTIAGTYKLSLTTVVYMNSAQSTSTYPIECYVAKNASIYAQYATTMYSYEDKTSHPSESRCAVQHIDMQPNDYIKIYTKKATGYSVTFDNLILCIEKVS